MKYIKNIFFLVILASLVAGCETPISLTVPNHTNPLVIEGSIENDKPATVVVSQSLSYFSEITLATILSSIDSNAVVNVSDDEGNTELLSLGFYPTTYSACWAKPMWALPSKGKLDTATPYR